MNAILTTLVNALDQSPHGHVICDEAGKVIWVNQAFTEMCGYILPEIIGKKPGSFLQGSATSPDDMEKLRTAIQLRKPCEVQILNYHKLGHTYWVNIALHYISENNDHPGFFIAIEKDITQMIASENELRREVVDLYNCVLSFSP